MSIKGARETAIDRASAGYDAAGQKHTTIFVSHTLAITRISLSLSLSTYTHIYKLDVENKCKG